MSRVSPELAKYQRIGREAKRIGREVKIEKL
jgi:hypothetical protein